MSATSSAHYPHSRHATAEKVRSSFADLWFPSSTLKLLLFALVFGLLIVGVSVGLDYFLLSEHDSPRAIVELSDGFTGVIAGVLVYRILSYGRNRRQRVAQRLEAIGEMNDQIRNALQIISVSAYAAAERAEFDHIRAAMERIEAALQDAGKKI